MILSTEVLEGYDEVGRGGYNSCPSYLVSAKLDMWGMFCPMACELSEYRSQSLAEKWWSMLVVAFLPIVAHTFAMMMVVWVLVFGSREVELFDKILVLLVSGGFGCIYGRRDLISRTRDLGTLCGEAQMKKVKYL
jgi:hypothetical protein